jgi:nicotinamidase-related amidase
MSLIHRFPLAASALLVIDVQDNFKAAAPYWARRNNLAFETNVASLVTAYREAKLPIYYILHSDSDPGWETTNPNYKLMDFLSPRENEPILHKTSRNSFTTTNLQRQLTIQGVHRLAITGIQMEQCCETTARVAADLGYDVDFVIDATLTFPIPYHEDGKLVGELGVAEIEERTRFVLRDRFARIVDTAQLINELHSL